jgi:hypothetical protein
LSSSQLQLHNNIDFVDSQVQIVSIDEIMAALSEMRVPAKHWKVAKRRPKGADMRRLAYNVIRHLREQDASDPRWAKHGRAKGCRCFDYSRNTGAVCKCTLWSAVLEHTQDILKNQPLPDDDDEGEEQAQQQNASHTESEGSGPDESEQIDSSAAKKFKHPSQINAPSRRVQKQQDKQQEKDR